MEKRLRDGHEGEEKEEVGEGTDAHNWSFSGEKDGKCTFAMAYVNAADADKFDWEDIENS